MKNSQANKNAKMLLKYFWLLSTLDLTFAFLILSFGLFAALFIILSVMFVYVCLYVCVCVLITFFGQLLSFCHQI